MCGSDRGLLACRIQIGLMVPWLLGLSGCTSTLHYLHRHTPVCLMEDCQTPFYQCSQCGRLVDRHCGYGCGMTPPAPFLGFSTTYWHIPACGSVPGGTLAAPTYPVPAPPMWAPPPDFQSSGETRGRPQLQRLPAVAAHAPYCGERLPRR